MTKFDKHIKQTLEHLSQNYVPDDWLAMETLLAEHTFDQQILQKINLHEEIITPTEIALFDNFLTAKSLDDFVQQKIELIEAAEMESDWDDFESKLDAQAFDNAINLKIAEVESALPVAADWDIFEGKLAVNAFDTEVKEKIASHTVPYRNSDWKQMRNLLEKLNPTQSYIWEKAKRLLPFFLFVLLIGSTGYWISSVSVNKEMPLVANKTKITTTIPQIPSASAQPLPLVEKTSVVAENNETLSSKKIAKNVITKNELAVSAKKEDIIEAKSAVFFKPSEFNPNTSVPSQTPIQKENASFISPKEEVKNEKEVVSAKQENIQKIAYQAFRLKNNIPPCNLNYHLEDASFDNWNPQIAIGAYTSVLGSVVELNDTLQIGAAIGLRTELSLNQKWSLTTDILYAKRNFETQYYKFYRPTNAYLQHLLIGNITSIDIPIMLKRKWNLDKKGRLGVYMQAGAVPTISLDENYTHYDPTTIENIGKNWEGNLREMAPVKQAFHFKPYMGNIIVAPGLQYAIGNLSLQVEPRFQWAIQPMSVENKSVHSLGLGISAVYALSQK